MQRYNIVLPNFRTKNEGDREGGKKLFFSFGIFESLTQYACAPIFFFCTPQIRNASSPLLFLFQKNVKSPEVIGEIERPFQTPLSHCSRTDDFAFQPLFMRRVSHTQKYHNLLFLKPENAYENQAKIEKNIRYTVKRTKVHVFWVQHPLSRLYERAHLRWKR